MAPCIGTVLFKEVHYKCRHHKHGPRNKEGLEKDVAEGKRAFQHKSSGTKFCRGRGLSSHTLPCILQLSYLQGINFVLKFHILDSIDFSHRQVVRIARAH